ncbi:hypothetical protein N9164_12100 [Draconibacterium sp.]|nr:hypothetical protein [Draconibacterium sp.]
MDTDIPESGFNLANDTLFEGFICKILKLRSSKIQVSKTDNGKLLKKVDHFINPSGSKDAFNPPKTVISICSDFIDDAESQNFAELCKHVAELSNKSTFFNLFFLSSKDTINFYKKIDVRSIYNNKLFPEQINTQKITEDIDLYCANFKSRKCIEFIINKPFHVDSGKTTLQLPIESNFQLSLVRHDKDDWQQYKVNGKSIQYGKSFPVSTNDILTFSGHVQKQFSETVARFEFPKRNELITCEIIFKKGLPIFISQIFFSFGVLILLFTLTYFFFLVGQIFKKKVDNNENELDVVSFKLKKNEVKRGYIIPCKLDGISIETTLRKKNTVSRAFVQYLLKNKKLKDKSAIIDTPFGDDEIRIGSNVVFNISLPPNKLKENVSFEIVEDGGYSGDVDPSFR